MSEIDKSFKIVEGENHAIIALLIPELPQVLPSLFIDYMKEILEKPIHLIFNFFVVDYVSQSWMGAILNLNSLLQESKKRVILLHVSPKLKENSPHTDFNNYVIGENLSVALDMINLFEEKIRSGDTSVNPPITFVRSFINATIMTFFIQAGTILIRQKIFNKKVQNEIDLFQGEIGSTVLVTADQFFYSLSISCTKDSYLKIYGSMVGEKFAEINSEMVSGLSELINIVNGQVKKMLTSNYEFNMTLPKVCLKREIPKEKVFFKGVEYLTYSGGETIIFPFQSNKGEIFIEIWYLKEFESYLLK